MDPSQPITLYYIHDPMCSWCWGFHPVFRQLQQQLAPHIKIHYLLGGLAADSHEPMTVEMKNFLQQTWRTIEAKIPGTVFNYDFWTECQPRRSTYAACRAVIAARYQNQEAETAMIEAIQKAYYLQARNPSDDSTLIALAKDIGLNTKQFIDDLNSKATQQLLDSEIALSRQLGVQGFPSLVLKTNANSTLIQLDYHNAGKMLEQIEALV